MAATNTWTGMKESCTATRSNPQTRRGKYSERGRKTSRHSHQLITDLHTLLGLCRSFVQTRVPFVLCGRDSPASLEKEEEALLRKVEDT